MELALWLYVWTFLIPINGLILYGIRNENARSKRLAFQIWKLARR